MEIRTMLAVVLCGINLNDFGVLVQAQERSRASASPTVTWSAYDAATHHEKYSLLEALTRGAKISTTDLAAVAAASLADADPQCRLRGLSLMAIRLRLRRTAADVANSAALAPLGPSVWKLFAEDSDEGVRAGALYVIVGLEYRSIKTGNGLTFDTGRRLVHQFEVDSSRRVVRPAILKVLLSYSSGPPPSGLKSAILRALNDTTPELQTAAIHAASTLSVASACPKVIELISAPAIDVRRAAVQNIMSICGVDAKPYLETLQARLSAEPDEKVRAGLRRAIDNLRREYAVKELSDPKSPERATSVVSAASH